MDSTKLPEKITTTPGGQAPAASAKGSQNDTKDVIPDEVPRRDGPGGEKK